MKPKAIMLCAALITGHVIANHVPPVSTKQDVLKSELMSVWHQRWAALSRNDARAYASFLADDVLVPANGLLYDKKALLDLALKFKEAAANHATFRCAVMTMSVYWFIAPRPITRMQTMTLLRNSEWLKLT